MKGGKQMVRKKGISLLLIIFFTASFLINYTAYAQDSVSGERIAGMDRYQTCINISKAGWPVSSPSGVAVIATGKDFPDALSAAPLAKKYNAPILLVGSDTLDPALSSELTRLIVKKVYIVGGTGVVSQEIENKLGDMGIETVRLFGQDRYETSAAVANEIGTSSKIVVATGEDFPDALSIAPWAASNGAPILLTQPDNLPPVIEEYIKKNSISNSYVIGGTGVVSENVMSMLPNPQRISGQDRFATNAAVLYKFNNEFDLSKIYIATGHDFPDALSGSALAALTKSPIILSNDGPLPTTKSYVDSNISRVNEVYILGGEGVVSNSAVEGIIPPVVSKVEISLPEPSVAMNSQIKVTANITMIPSNAPKPAATFTVSDPEIATVSPDGTITGLKVGNTRITASVGDKSSSINLLVKMDRLIVIDPGHGGTSIGAVPRGEDGSQLLDYREAVLNMQIAQIMKQKLEDLGARVVLTRNSDVNISLEDRAKIANDLNADWFISIHHNSATNRSATGTSVYYSSYKPGIKDGRITAVVQDSKEIATRIINAIMSLGLNKHGIGVYENDFAVNRLTNMPSVLVEVGFISNITEFRKISQYSFQVQVAEKITQALKEFYESGSQSYINLTP